MSTATATPTPATTTVATRPFQSVVHAFALAKRSLIKTMRTPEALVDVTLQPIIFLLLFTVIFGGAVAGSQQDYLEFLLPGVLAQTIGTACIAIGQNLNQDIEKGVFDRFRSMPISRSAPLVGAVAADVVRYVILIVVILTTGFVMGFRFHTSPELALLGCLVSIGFALSLAWVSVWIGMLARTPGAVQGIMFLIVLPLSFASNVFVPIDTLPDWIQGFVRVNPISQLVATVRGCFLGGPVAAHLLYTVLWMIGLVVVFLPLALRAYRRRV
jgi:oleandomycin transport system permease protein